ncbi:hypothetical protein [Acetobacter malorum]|uniref:hypothetical protein n=1 Tax=Acetobacter malorum TaxID=178901 RepID=UPI000AACA380|nr:hypothetical protein [Acetobacter malorum]
MSLSLKSLFACASFLALSNHAMAASKSPIEGYHCMMLNQSMDQMQDPAHTVFARAKPDAQSENKGPIGTVVAIPDNIAPTNGYLPSLNFLRKTVWVPADALAPYRVASDPSMTCRPAVRNDGKLDFIFGH